MQKRIMYFHIIDVCRSGQNIAEDIMNVLVYNNLHRIVIAVTLDNISLNIVAIEIVIPLLSFYHEKLFSP